MRKSNRLAVRPNIDLAPITLDMQKLEVYEAGAVLVAVLAYPNFEEEQRRARLHGALCALALRARSESDVQWAITPQLIKPVYADFGDAEIAAGLNSFDHRLRDRMIAGRMAMAYLKEASTGQVPKLPDGVKRLSLNQLSEMVLADAGRSDPENVETRIWRASLPVIHLASACQVMMQETARIGETINFAHLLQYRRLIEWLVDAAGQYAPLLAKSSILLDPRRLIQIRLV